MTRTELFDEFYAKHQDEFQSKAAAKRAFDGLFAIMTSTMASGKSMTITGFGKFRLTRLKDREVTNPRTKEVIASPAHTVVRFSPGRPLALAVKDVPVKESDESDEE